MRLPKNLLFFSGLVGCLMAEASQSAASEKLLTDETIGQLVSDYLGSRKADGLGTPCSNYFEVGTVEVTDRRIGESTAKAVAIITVHPKENVSTSTILLCYGLLTNKGWRAGGDDQMQGTYNFELWDSGWRLLPPN